MRILLLAVAFAPSLALAGPPAYANYVWTGLAPTDHGLWLIGVANCDEAGMHPAAFRLDGSEPVELHRERVAELAKSEVGAASWTAGDDVYAPGEHPRVSHDRGKTWTPLEGLAAQIATVAGAGDAVFAVTPLHRVVRTTDHGKTWDGVAVIREAYHCLSGS